MILFLDFDGVLHPELRCEPDFCRNHLLWQVLRACPAVNVVFSTSWREIYAHEELVMLTTRNGGEDLAHRFIGCTPIIPFSQDAPYSREAECRLWMQNNKPQQSWLAIDDRALFFTPFSPALYLTERSTGLNEMDVGKIIERLQS